MLRGGHLLPGEDAPRGVREALDILIRVGHEVHGAQARVGALLTDGLEK